VLFTGGSLLFTGGSVLKLYSSSGLPNITSEHQLNEPAVLRPSFRALFLRWGRETVSPNKDDSCPEPHDSRNLSRERSHSSERVGSAQLGDLVLGLGRLSESACSHFDLETLGGFGSTAVGQESSYLCPPIIEPRHVGGLVPG
jgi:hypothetical protein